MRIRDSANYVLLNIYFGISLLIAYGSSQTSDGSYIPCRDGGFCTPSYLCVNSTIITDGTGLIDLRLSEKDCPDELVCCQHADDGGSQISQCQGKCVLLSMCLDDVYDYTVVENSILDSIKTSCPANQICCSNVREPQFINSLESFNQRCQGKCVPSYQCLKGKLNTVGKDIINLRTTDDGCDGNDIVCCMEPDIEKPTFELPKLCDGTCVPIHQCTNGTINSAAGGVIDLRSFDDACPGDLVCCNSKPELSIEAPKLCEGTCVPFYQCTNGSFNSAGEGVINLRSFDYACPGELVCCSTNSEQNIGVPKFCNGTCVPLYECSNETLNSAGEGVINLRSFDGACSGELVCCSPKPKPNIEVPKICDGTCVPFYQCSDGSFNNAGVGMINLRSFGGACSEELVCCGFKPKPNIEVPKFCNGTCVPLYHCKNGTFNSVGEGIINLRTLDDACPGELVCCNSKPEVISNTCQCVPFSQCLDGAADIGGKNLLDLRTTTQDCTGDQVCCSRLRPSYIAMTNSNDCKGTCVPFYQCLNKTFHTGGKEIPDVRFNSCPGDLVCCEAPTVQKIPMKRFCQGTCVPFDQCNTAGKDILNLRSYDDCPDDQICCEISAKENKPDTSANNYPERMPGKPCDGKCVPLSQCGDSPQAMLTQLIDLRLGLTYYGCLDATVCCANPIRITPEVEQWMHWINDINNMILPQKIVKNEKCFLNIARDVGSIKEDEIPWLVTIWRRHQGIGVMQNEYLCAGTLVRADVALVPADCIQSDTNARLYVRIGSYNLKAMSGFEERHIIRKIIHPDYDNAYNPNNAALLFLPEHRKNKPDEACIFGLNEQFREQDCFIAGWNNLDLLDVRSPFTVPMKFYSPIVKATTCRPGYFCTGKNQFSESCDRLHGSPVICPDQTGHNWKIAGMVVRNNLRCDHNGIPDSLLEATRLDPWIREQLSPSFVQKPSAHGPSRKYLPVK